jgi:hypothetical protein
MYRAACPAAVASAGQAPTRRVWIASFQIVRLIVNYERPAL